MKAIRVHKHGSADVLTYEDVPLPEPGRGEVRVKVEAAGVNYVDTYHRRGAYEQSLPFTLGMEAAGVLDALGDGVTTLSPGQSVAYATSLGAYGDYAVVPAAQLVQVPDGIEMETAAAVLLQGLTAHYLTHSTFPLQEGDVMLVHAAAGGVGLLMVQIGKMLGARVIGTASTPEKIQLALDQGADEMIPYTETDFVEATLDLTEGRGVDVVYDGVGQTTFRRGLDCLRPRGFMVLYGQASGAVDSIDPQLLNQKGSLFLTRPSLGHYVADQEELQARADDLFGWIASDALSVRIDQTFPLSKAAAAHRYIEGRKTMGKILLLPQHEGEPATPEETINLADEVDEASWESFPASDPPPY